MNLPELNARILQVIDFKTNGNINAFAKMISVSQQKLDRLFRKDKRTEKIPSVPTEILVNITKYCVDIDSNWLLTGEGSPTVDNSTNIHDSTLFLTKNQNGDNVAGEQQINYEKSNTKELKKEIEHLKREIELLTKQLGQQAKIIEKLLDK